MKKCVLLGLFAALVSCEGYLGDCLSSDLLEITEIEDEPMLEGYARGLKIKLPPADTADEAKYCDHIQLDEFKYYATSPGLEQEEVLDFLTVGGNLVPANEYTSCIAVYYYFDQGEIYEEGATGSDCQLWISMQWTNLDWEVEVTFLTN